MWLAWNLCQSLHLPGGTNGKEPSWQCRRWKRGGFHPWIREDPPGKAWQPTPVFCPGESRGRRSLAGYSPGGCKESDTTEVTWQTPTVHWRAQKQGRRLPFKCPRETGLKYRQSPETDRQTHEFASSQNYYLFQRQQAHLFQGVMTSGKTATGVIYPKSLRFSLLSPSMHTFVPGKLNRSRWMT